eukprot:COSAG05_NODE_1733_length_4178_cov_47.990684_3_plen_30_part_00
MITRYFLLETGQDTCIEGLQMQVGPKVLS